MPQHLAHDSSTLVQVWFGSALQQAITWTNVDSDPCRHMASLDHNESIIQRFSRSPEEILILYLDLPITHVVLPVDWTPRFIPRS